MELKQKIRNLRKAKDISKKTMAEKLNMSEGAYGSLEKIEMGTKLDIVRLQQIADILEVDIQELLQNEPTHLICKQINHAQLNTNNNIGKDQSEFINHLKTSRAARRTSG